MLFSEKLSQKRMVFKIHTITDDLLNTISKLLGYLSTRVPSGVVLYTLKFKCP